MKARIDVKILEIMSDPKNLKLSARDIVERLKGNDNAGAGTFYKKFCEYMESRRTAGTRSLYKQTLSRIMAFDNNIEKKSFEDIDRKWLENFEEYLSQTAKSANARSLELARSYVEKTVKHFNEEVLPVGYKVEQQSFRWWGKESRMRYMLLVLLVIVIIYVMCAMTFDSLKFPFAVILMIPVSFIGVFLVFGLTDFVFDQGVLQHL